MRTPPTCLPKSRAASIGSFGSSNRTPRRDEPNRSFCHFSAKPRRRFLDVTVVDARLGDGSGVAAAAEVPRSGFVPHGFGGGGAAGETMTTLRVLVAEDDPMIGTLLAEVLTEMGYDVCAIEATEADTVAAAVRCRPDMMIVDAWLGDGSGVAAVEAVLRTGFVPHVFVSGDMTRVQARRPDAVVLQKPFREADLARAIQRALAARPAC
jgi:CheY-like chemotaxis protein